MHDPMTQICSFPSYRQQEWMQKRWWIPKFIARYELFTLWHVDPEKDGSDDSCGWFKRAKHGDKEVLEKIVKAFEFDWDRTFEPSKQDHDDEDGEFIPKVYYCGLFQPNGDPHFSVSGIVINLFFIACIEHFKSDGRTNWKRGKKFMRKHLLDILLFAENPTDSMFDSITRKFQKGCGEEYGTRAREERIRGAASTIYGWILRAEQPWYRHPRWHVHHFKIQIRLLQRLHRWLFVKCAICKKRLRYNETAIGNWGGNSIWHERCDASLRVPESKQDK